MTDAVDIPQIDSSAAHGGAKPPSGERAFRWGSRALQVLSVGVILLTLAGLVIRFTVKDRYLSTALVFYATPLPVLLLGIVWSLVHSVWQGRGAASLRWLIFLLILGGIWIQEDWRTPSSDRSGWTAESISGQQADHSEEISVLFWNVARRQDLEVAAKFLRDKDSDIVGLVEVQGNPEERRAFWQKQLPNHHVTVLGGNMYLLTKGASGQAIPHDLGGGSYARQLEVRLGHRLYEILLVDVHANPLQSREAALQRLAKLADELGDRRLIIMGDFNTPEDSVHLQFLRKRHQLAFDVAGQGYGPTWPIPFPLMQLDQIWTNAHVFPVRCRHSWTWASDHEPIEAIIRPGRFVPENSDETGVR